MLLNFDGEYSNTIVIEVSATVIKSPIFLGIDFKPFNRVLNLEFSIEVGYNFNWIINVKDSMTSKYINSTGDWELK